MYVTYAMESILCNLFYIALCMQLIVLNLFNFYWSLAYYKFSISFFSLFLTFFIFGLFPYIPVCCQHILFHSILCQKLLLLEIPLVRYWTFNLTKLAFLLLSPLHSVSIRLFPNFMQLYIFWFHKFFILFHVQLLLLLVACHTILQLYTRLIFHSPFPFNSTLFPFKL